MTSNACSCLVVGRIIVGDGGGRQERNEALDVIERLADRIGIDGDVALGIHQMCPERSERRAPGLVRVRAVGSAAERKHVARLVTLLGHRQLLVVRALGRTCLMLTQVPEALHDLTWLKRLYLGTDAEARENPELVFANGSKNINRHNALRAVPGAIVTRPTSCPFRPPSRHHCLPQSEASAISLQPHARGLPRPALHGREGTAASYELRAIFCRSHTRLRILS
jgi:hypothetical protein